MIQVGRSLQAGSGVTRDRRDELHFSPYQHVYARVLIADPFLTKLFVETPLKAAYPSLHLRQDVGQTCEMLASVQVYEAARKM